MKKLILLITAILLVLCLTHPSQTQAANVVLSFSPTSQTVSVGQILSTTILLDTGGETINRVLAQITYSPTNLLTAQSIDTTGSFINYWYQQNLSSGQITLEGGVSGSGTSGSQLTFAKINFEAQSAGTVTLTFAANSAVYRESDDANILTEARTVDYSITTNTPTPTPSTILTSTPTVTPRTTPGPTTTITPEVTGTLTPTPTQLPDGGTVTPTVILTSVMIGLVFTGLFLILRKT